MSFVRTQARLGARAVNLTQEFPGLPHTHPSAVPAAAPATTVLPNGLTVCTTRGRPTSTVTLTYPSGSAAEDWSKGERGASHVAHWMGYKSNTQGVSTLKTLREFENAGVTPFTSTTRFASSIGYRCSPSSAATFLSTLSATPSFETWDVRDAVQTCKDEASAAAGDPAALLSALIFEASYGGCTALGRSDAFPSERAPTAAAARAFREREYGAQGAVLTATGLALDHDTFVEAVKKALGGAPAGKRSPAAPSAFVAGGSASNSEVHCAKHVAVSFDGSKASRSAVAAVVKLLEAQTRGSGLYAFSTASLLVPTTAGGPVIFGLSGAGAAAAHVDKAIEDAVAKSTGADASRAIAAARLAKALAADSNEGDVWSKGADASADEVMALIKGMAAKNGARATLGH